MAALFQPINLRGLTLPNRVVVSPMCQYSAVDGTAQPWHHAHLGQLAMSGAGLLFFEATAVEDIGRITPGCLGLYSDENQSAIAGLVALIRSVNPTPVSTCMQLGHAGRKGSSHVPWQGGQQIALDQGGWQAVGPSALEHLENELPPRALQLNDMAALKARFVKAVERTAALGIDAIELHAAHGYLMHQFLSPVANQRTDNYGGTLENRMRFPLEVFEAMRQTWPANKPMGVRISATDWDASSSWDINESTVFAREIAALGCDWIDVSSGGVSRNQKIVLKPGYQVEFAQAIKAATDIPVMTVGLITEPRQAEEILQAGQADLIAMARAFLFNPRWVWHAAAQMNGAVTAPPQYWRCLPSGTGRIFGDAPVGQR